MLNNNLNTFLTRMLNFKTALGCLYTQFNNNNNNNNTQF